MSDFELLSPLYLEWWPSIPFEDSSQLVSSSTRPLLEGEWLKVYNNVASREGDNNAATADEATGPSFLHVTEPDRTDILSMPDAKVTVVLLGPIWAKTKLVDVTGLGAGSPLSVQDITFSGQVVRGLALQVAGFVVAYVTRIYTDGFVEFVRAGIA